MRILLVDDEPALLRSVARSLRFEGYTVSTASDGIEALEALADCRPDAVILDLMLPTLGGLEVCRRMRSAGEVVPILMLTARDAVTDRVTGLDAGADDYLPSLLPMKSSWPVCVPCFDERCPLVPKLRSAMGRWWWIPWRGVSPRGRLMLL